MEEVGQYWILDVQKSLQQNKKFENWRREFNLFTDCNGVLSAEAGCRTQTILTWPSIPSLLLQIHFATLAITNCHKSVMHDGVKDTLADLPSTFWLVRGRQVVKKLLHSCVTCR